MPPTILLPLDGTTDADDAVVATALDRAERDGGSVYALYVVDTGRYGEPALSSAEVVVDEHEDAGHRLLGQVAARAATRGIDVETRCCHGRPHDQLLAVARELEADAVVLDRRVPHAVRTGLADVVDAVVSPTDRVTA